MSNSGNGAISSLAIVPQSGLEISDNNCGSSLAAGAGCTYVVKFNPQNPVSGTSSVVVNYNINSNSQSATTTVNYKSVNVVAGLTIASGGNPNFDFLTRTDTPSQNAMVTITNTGNSLEDKLTFALPTYFTTSTTGISAPDTPCSSNLVLQPNQSCKILLVYDNNSVTNKTTDTITVNYVYGQAATTASSNVSVTYQAVQSAAILPLTPNPVN